MKGLRIAFGIIFAALFAASAASAQTLDQKRFGALQADGTDTASVTEYYMLLAGVDPATGLVQAMSVNATGGLTLAGSLTLADDISNSTGVVPTGAFLLGYESVGGTWDRVHMDTVGNLLVSLGTNLDYLNDSVTAYGPIADNAAITDGTTRGMPMMGYYDETIGTALTENDGAIVRINAQRALVSAIESGSTRGLYSEVLTAGADNTVNTTNGLFVYNANMAFDGTTWDRMEVDANGNLNVTLATALDSANDSINGNIVDNAAFTDGTTRLFMSGFIYDDTAGTALTENDAAAPRIDSKRAVVTRIEGGTRGTYATLSMLTGHYTPDGANNINLAANTSSACTASNALTVGNSYIVQVSGRVFCRLGADNTATATTSDMPHENPGVYYISPSATSADTLCCITSAGSVDVDITPVTYN